MHVTFDLYWLKEGQLSWISILLPTPKSYFMAVWVSLVVHPSIVQSPSIISLSCETWLSKIYPGYTWFGQNRQDSQRSPRGLHGMNQSITNIIFMLFILSSVPSMERNLVHTKKGGLKAFIVHLFCHFQADHCYNFLGLLHQSYDWLEFPC